MKKHSILKLGLAMALTVVLLVAVMAVSAFAADDLVTVDNLTDFAAALSGAPTDGSVRTIKITGDFTLTSNYSVVANSNVIITSDDRYVLTCDRPSGTGYSFLNIYAGASLTLTGKVTMHGVLESNRAVYARAAGANFVLDGDAIIENFSAASGAGVQVDSGASATINSGTIQGCRATSNRGGGIKANAGATLTINGGTIQNCTSVQGGGGVWAGGSCTDLTTTFIMTGGLITGNSVTGDSGDYSRGGGLAVLAEKAEAASFATVNATITGGTFTNNTCSREGGGVALWAFTSAKYHGTLNLTVENITVSGNTATRAGGGVWVMGSTTYTPGASLENVDVIGNTSNTYGGGIYMNTPVSLTDVNVFGNTAKGNGGGIYFANTAQNYTIDSSVTVAGNVCTGSGGGGIMTECSTLVINGTVIGGSEPGTSTPDPTGTRGNYSATQGGGLRIYRGAVTVNSGTFENNTSGTLGGAIYICNGTDSITPTLKLYGGTFSGNSGSDGSVSMGTPYVSCSIKGNVETNGEADFFALPAGMTIKKDGAFTWSGTISIHASGDFNDGDAVVTSADGTVTAADVDAFTVSIGPLYTTSLSFDSSENRLILNKAEVVFDIMNTTQGVGYSTSELLTALDEVVSGDTLRFTTSHTYAWDARYDLQDRSLTLITDPGVLVTFRRSDGAASNFIMLNVRNCTLTLDGDLTFDANGTSTVFQLYSSSSYLVINDGVIITGATTRGIVNWGTVTMNGGEICYNGTATPSSNSGGAIYNYRNFVMHGGELHHNSARWGGAIESNYSSSAPSVTIDGGSLYNNTANASGGAIFIERGNLTINNTNGAVRIYNNTTIANHSGAIGVIKGDSSYADPVTTINGAQIYDNTSVTSGGGVRVTSGSLTISGSSIYNNTASGGNGGGVYFSSSGTLTVNDNSVIRDNKASTSGGGIYQTGSGSFAISDTTISGNRAQGSYGGGLDIDAVNTTGSITGSSINNNVSYGGGGGFIANGLLTVSDTEIKGNVCGAYYEDNVLTARAGGTWGGSGAYVDNSARVTFDDVTITGNGNSNQGIFIGTGASRNNSVTFDGDITVKDNSPSFDNYDAVNKIYTVGADEEAKGMNWYPGQGTGENKTTVKAKDTLSSADVVLNIGATLGTDLTVGTVVDGTDALSTTDIGAALAGFATPNGVTFVQSGSDILLSTPASATYTLVSVNNGADAEYTVYDFGTGIKLPEQDDIVATFTDDTTGTAFEGSDYGLNNFVGFADVTGYGTSPVLNALYSSGAAADAADISGKTLYATWANAKTVPGASIKVTSDGLTSGIRFLTLLETDTMAAIGIENITSTEWDNGDIGYTFGVTMTKDYGDAAAKTQTYQSAGGKLFNDTWFGDELYDASFDNRGTNHVFSFGLNLTSSQYEYAFTPTAFIKVQYTDGVYATRTAPIPTEGDPAEPLVRTARGVARSYAAWLVSGANPDLGKTNLGLKPAQIAALEAIADGTFDLGNKTYENN